MRLLAPALAAAVALGCEPRPPLPPEAPQNPPAEAYGAQQSAADPNAGREVAVDDFVQPLSQYGAWVDDPTYGRVWKPSAEVAGPDFVPYASDGAWVANEDGGWVFESRYDADWGWATYHYGRWLELDTVGWVWVPGTVWAPSWVEWRYGGGYVGWVPMGPPGVVIAESRWAFVEERRFGEPGTLAHRLPPERIHAAFVGAAPMVEVRGGGWTVGPPAAQLRAAGAPVRTVRAAPGRAGGVARAQAPAPPGANRGAALRPSPAPVAAPASAPRPAAPPPVPRQPSTAPPGARNPGAAVTPVPVPRPKPPQAPAPAPTPHPSGGKRH
jgi:hypothetical protein